MITNSAVRSSTRTFLFQKYVLFKDTANNAYYKPPDSLLKKSYLAIIANNGKVYVHTGVDRCQTENMDFSFKYCHSASGH